MAGMTNDTGGADGVRLWRDQDGLHIDVRGLPCPEPLVTVLRLIDGGKAGDVLLAHLSQEPLMLYFELDNRGWRHRLIAATGESSPPDGEVVLKIERSRP
jgi:hypothetical protein